MAVSQGFLRSLAQSPLAVVRLSLAGSTSTHVHLIVALASVGPLHVVFLFCVFVRSMAVTGSGGGLPRGFVVADAARALGRLGS